MGNALAFAWEDALIIFVQRFMSGPLVKIAGLITEFGDATILVGIVGMFYWALNKELGKKLVLNLSFINIVNPLVKSSVKRIRPYMVNPDIQCLKAVNKEGDIYNIAVQEYSFPSGHADNSIAVYGTLTKNSRRRFWKVILVVLILLVAFSRIALGVHYPTDILGGWIVGLLCLWLYSVLVKKLGRNRTFLVVGIIGLAGVFVAKSNDYFTGYGMFFGASLAILFEEKFVNFEGTKKVLHVILRTAVGAGLYLGLNTLLKMPFTPEFLGSGTLPAFAVRAVRYAVICFLLLGVYPMCFRFFSGRKGTPGETEEPA